MIWNAKDQELVFYTVYQSITSRRVLIWIGKENRVLNIRQWYARSYHCRFFQLHHYFFHISSPVSYGILLISVKQPMS